MTNTFAIAVDRYLDALARFDCPVPPLGPLAVDWCAMREATVLAEEAELERRFGRGTRSAGGGGELRGRSDGRSLPVADFRPTHVRIRDALIRLGPATTAQVAEAAGASNFTSTWLLKAEKRGDVRRLGEHPRRWEWVGERPPVNGHAVPVNGDRSSVNTETVLVNSAADVPQEEETMPRGKKGPSDEQLLDEAKTFAVSFTTDSLLDRLEKRHGKDAPGYETLHKRLAGMRKRGILTGGRGAGKGAPTVWAITGRDTKGRPAPGLLVSAAAAKAAKPLDPERGATSWELYGKPAAAVPPHEGDAAVVEIGTERLWIGTVAAHEREVARRIAAALRRRHLM